MKILKKMSICILTVLLAACGTADSKETEKTVNLTTYSATADNEHALFANGQTVTYENIEVNKSGNGEGDDADFYGENAAIYAGDGANMTISNATITTSGQYANGVFSYGEETTITISDSVITTSERNSGGIMVTGGGTLYANNLTIETEGGSSAAIRSDRGGGTMVVDGGSYTANGSGSPAIYSTADISVANATLTSGTAQAVVVEGGNNVKLTDCTVTGNNTVQNSDNSTYYQAVMLYQSMSGDASAGDGSFEMTGGSLTSLNGGMFFVTNATYTIDLNNVDLTYASDDLLRIEAAGWGNDGNNGGQVTFNLDDQTIEGVITLDDISKLNMYLTNGSSFTGTFDNEGEVYVEIEEGSTWTLTADCSISSLTCASGCINLNGYTLTVNGTEYNEGSASKGEAITFTVSDANQMQDMKDFGGENPMNNDGGNPPEIPDGENGNNGENPMNGNGGNPPEKPEGEQGGDGETPPEIPEGNGQGQGGENPPEKPDGNMGGDGETPPEKPDGEK